MEPIYTTINLAQTGLRISYLMSRNGLTVRDIQDIMGFESGQAIYNWIHGRTLPKIDNLVILSRVLHTTIDDILVISDDNVRGIEDLKGSGEERGEREEE